MCAKKIEFNKYYYVISIQKNICIWSIGTHTYKITCILLWICAIMYQYCVLPTMYNSILISFVQIDYNIELFKHILYNKKPTNPTIDVLLISHVYKAYIHWHVKLHTYIITMILCNAAAREPHWETIYKNNEIMQTQKRKMEYKNRI